MLSLTPSTLWSTFSAKAELLGASVARATSADAALDLVRQSATGPGWTASIARRYPRIAERGGGRAPLAERAAARTDGPRADMVATGVFAVAETGSVAINEPAADRGACFLAERLWLLVPEREIVPNLDEALQRIRDMVRGGASHPLLMSGPSRTADIERVLTVGVHGPRAVTVVIVGGT